MDEEAFKERCLSTSRSEIRSYLQHRDGWRETSKCWKYEGSDGLKIDFLDRSFIVEHIADAEGRDPIEVLEAIEEA